jgi:Fe-S cluster assembly protein SufD
MHNGEHAKAKFNAVYLLGEAEHFDLHSTIEHVMPNGTTLENARGIVGDKAKAVFNGRIHIHRDAQKTLAELHNRNLLLSRRGQINTKPELEIYADDVLCAHGATVAETEEETLYYLLSRGISRSQALVMLNFGFIQELVDQMPNQHLAQWLKPQLQSRFVEMEVK